MKLQTKRLPTGMKSCHKQKRSTMKLASTWMFCMTSKASLLHFSYLEVGQIYNAYLSRSIERSSHRHRTILSCRKFSSFSWKFAFGILAPASLQDQLGLTAEVLVFTLALASYWKKYYHTMQWTQLSDESNQTCQMNVSPHRNILGRNFINSIKTVQS